MHPHRCWWCSGEGIRGRIVCNRYSQEEYSRLQSLGLFNGNANQLQYARFRISNTCGYPRSEVVYLLLPELWGSAPLHNILRTARTPIWSLLPSRLLTHCER